MRSRILLAAIVLSVTALTAWSALEWQSVRVTSDQGAARGCAPLGMVSIRVDATTTWRLTQEVTLDRLKKKAAEKGANLIVLIGGVTEGGKAERNMSATGEAYMCGKAIPQQSGRSASVNAEPGEPAPNASQTACGKNFEVRGSRLRPSGTIFTTFVDIPDVNRATALERIIARLPANKLTLLTTDSESGTISAQGSLPRDKTYPVDISIADAGSAVRAAMTIKLPMGVGAEDEQVRDTMCALLMSARGASSTAVKSQGTSTAPSGGSVEERLQKLESLYKKKVISKEEYEKKRAEILKEL